MGCIHMRYLAGEGQVLLRVAVMLRNYSLCSFLCLIVSYFCFVQESSALQHELQSSVHTDFVWSVALSGNGKLLVTGSNDRTAILWDVDGGKSLQHFKGHRLVITNVALSADGKYVAMGSLDKTASLWDATTGKRLRMFEHGARVTSVALSAGAKY